MKKQLDFLVQYEDRISRLAKALKWKIYHLLFGFSAQASTLGVFKHASGLGSTNLQIFRFNFPTKRLWASLICSKTARYRLFLAVVRCCVTTTLAAETFSLLSVYLNYKFGLGLPSFHLFFSLFKFEIGLKVFGIGLSTKAKKNVQLYNLSCQEAWPEFVIFHLD